MSCSSRSQAVFLGGEDARDGRHFPAKFGVFDRRMGHQFGRARVGGSLKNFRARQVFLHPGTALGQGLGMRIKTLNVLALAVAGQTVLDRQDNLRHDLQVAVHEHVERVRDHAFGGVLHRHDAVIRAGSC